MNQPVAGLPGGGLIRLRLDISYDGRAFAGWARQPGLRTVQGELERVLGYVCGMPVEVTCAGRTDAGVHARGQVAHLDVPSTLPSVDLGRLNRALPDDVRVDRIAAAPPDFDARFSALWRRYTYRVTSDPAGPAPLERHLVLPWSRPLDVDRMNQAGRGMLGERDFAPFCKQRKFASTVRELLELSWERSDGVCVLTVRADAFCRSMVRSLVGVLLPVGDGRRPIDWPATVLTAGVKHSALTVMPAFPLVLEEVGYPDPTQYLSRQAQTRTHRTG